MVLRWFVFVCVSVRLYLSPLGGFGAGQGRRVTPFWNRDDKVDKTLGAEFWFFAREGMHFSQSKNACLLNYFPFVLSLSALTPSKLERQVLRARFLSSITILLAVRCGNRTQDGWVRSTNASSVLCCPAKVISAPSMSSQELNVTNLFKGTIRKSVFKNSSIGIVSN